MSEKKLPQRWKLRRLVKPVRQICFFVLKVRIHDRKGMQSQAQTHKLIFLVKLLFRQSNVENQLGWSQVSDPKHKSGLFICGRDLLPFILSFITFHLAHSHLKPSILPPSFCFFCVFLASLLLPVLPMLVPIIIMTMPLYNHVLMVIKNSISFPRVGIHIKLTVEPLAEYWLFMTTSKLLEV